MSDNKENHPFDEEMLRSALSESLQSAPAEEPDADQTGSATPLFDREAMADKREEEGFDAFSGDDELNYGDLAESWQEEDEEEYLPEDEEEEAAMEQTHDEPIHAYPETKKQLAPGAPQPAPNASGNSGGAEGTGLSRLVIGIIVLCAIGFTASNWMTSRKVDALVGQLEETQARLDALTQKVSRLPAGDDTADSSQSGEAMLAQLTAGVLENREAIDTLKRSVETLANIDRSQPKQDIPVAGPAETAAPGKPEKTPPAAKKAKEQPKLPAKPAAGKQSPGWSVVLMSLKNEAMADEELAVLLGKGIKAEKHTVLVKGETYHQLRAGSFEQKEAALDYSRELSETLGYKGAWVSRD